MKKLSVSLGFDDERPYGEWAQTEKGKEFLKKKLAFIQQMNESFDAEDIPRTHFILGSYLEAARNEVGATLMRDLYNKENPLLDLQQHTYSHGVMETLQGVDKPPMTAEEYIADVCRASEVMQDILDVKPHGLRMPYGYERDLSVRPDMLQGFQNAGITYVSADMGWKATLEGPLTKERQPHTYAHVGFPDIVEMPGHGLQDVVFTREKAKQIFGKDEARSPEEARQHFHGLLDQAEKMEMEKVSVDLILHPWAVMEFDPNLEILLDVMCSARERGFEVLSYGGAADTYRNESL